MSCNEKAPDGSPSRDAAAPSQRTLLIPPAPTSVGQDSHAGPRGLANPEGAMSVRPAIEADAYGVEANDERADPRPSTSSSSCLDPPHRRPRMGLIRVALCTTALGALILVQATNISMMTTAAGAIARDLDAAAEGATSWLTSAYLIAMSALGPLYGKLSGVFSPRSCICTAGLLLAAGLLGCASAADVNALIAARVVAGAGACGVFTVAAIIVLELASPERKGFAIGLLNSAYTVGVAAGATAAGALVGVVGWRALFWLQVPIVLVAAAVLLLAIPAGFATDRHDEKAHDDDNDDDNDRRLSTRATMAARLASIDYLGAATLTTCLVLLLYALSASGAIPLLPLAGAALTGAAFVGIEVRVARDPIVPVALLRSRGLLLTCLGTTGFMMARWCVLFFTPTYAIAVRGWPLPAGGALLVPTNAGFAAGGLLAGAFHIRRAGSFYRSTLAAYAVFPATLLALAALSQRDASATVLVLVLFVCGCATGAAVNYGFAHVLHLTPRDEHYVVTALMATFRGFAGPFGSAVGGGLFARTITASLSARFAEIGVEDDGLVRKLLAAPELVWRLDGVRRDMAIAGYEEGLQTLWLSAALLALVVVFVQAATGWKGAAEEKTSTGERRPLLRDERAR